MIATISQKLSLGLLKSNAINQEELNVYAYGIQLLILSIIDWCITFLFVLLITIFYKGIMPSEKVLDFPVDCNTLTGSVNL